MKLNFRDLKQQKFTIDAEPSETISQIKDKIAAEKGWEASQQKLIYSGKILADANTVESYTIEEKGFIVCMVSKPKTTAAPKPAPSTPAVSVSTPAQPPAPQQSTTTAPAQQNPPATPTPAQGTATGTDAPSWNDPSALLVGERSQAAIQEMEAMGFQRAEIDRAMRAAFFNPDRAIEYLLNGIPENVQAQQRQAAPAPAAGGDAPTQAQPTTQAPTSDQTAAVPDDDGINLFEAAAQAGQQGTGVRSGLGQARSAPTATAGQGGQLDLNVLRNNTQFQQLRQLVQQQPAMLEPILQQLAEGNPQLAQMISQNPDQFLQLLSEDVGGDTIGGMGEAGPLPPGATPISVTEEERDAIERLCRLGFTRDAVIQAYFACDKNEELAANFLFDQPDEDEGGQ